MFPVIHNAASGPHRITGTPIKLSQTPGSPGDAAPLLGENTVSVLAELLSLDQETITSLLKAGVIVQPAS
jgi:crotonobetainyl-CoA:carnitine CoA-transferase CaiB-like acyl-CoA transferase